MTATTAEKRPTKRRPPATTPERPAFGARLTTSWGFAPSNRIRPSGFPVVTLACCGPSARVASYPAFRARTGGGLSPSRCNTIG
ncbi:MAG: hypothetical protein K0Q72_1255 [Armatimonadetes bacterium]|jgi:hypothetical protein|nr:hypothetical protein [Armatimonadota bacterium]